MQPSSYVVGFAEEFSNRRAARKFKVDEKRVREWKLQKRILKELYPLKKMKKRFPGGGGKPRLQIRR